MIPNPPLINELTVKIIATTINNLSSEMMKWLNQKRVTHAMLQNKKGLNITDHHSFKTIVTDIGNSKKVAKENKGPS